MRRLAESAPLAMVLAITSVLRGFHLASLPAGLLYDEAFDGLDAVRILDGARPIFLPANTGREVLFAYLEAASVGVFGQTDLALRLVAAVAGVLTVLATYRVLRRLDSPRVALLASGWLAVSFWQVLLSRLAFRTILVPLLGALAVLFLWRGLDLVWRDADDRRAAWALLPPQPAAGWFAVSGIAFGLALYTYPTARFLPLVVLVFAGYLLLAHPARLRQAAAGLVLTGLLTLLVFLPEGVYFLRHPDAFVARAEQVSVLNAAFNGGSPVNGILQASRTSLAMFAIAGDADRDHNLPGRPLFDPASTVLLILGLGLGWRRRRDPRMAFLLLWLAIMLIPNWLSVRGAPNYLRLTGIVPAVFAFPALGADWLWQQVDRRWSGGRRWLPGALAGLALLAGAGVTAQAYFVTWARWPGVAADFGAARWLAIDTAQTLVRHGDRPVFVGAGDAPGPLLEYATTLHRSANGLRLFDGSKSLIFPTPPQPAIYLFPDANLPPPDLLRRFFPGQTGQVVATGPDGAPIWRYQLPATARDSAPPRDVPARFGEQLQVAGFGFPAEVNAGQPLAVRWYWQVGAPDPQDLVFFNQVVTADGRRWGERDDLAFEPGTWPTGTTGISTFSVPVSPRAPSGLAWLLVGIYHRQGVQRLPIFDRAGRPAGTALRLGPIRIQGVPPISPAPQHPLAARFADEIDLRGYDLTPDPLVPGGTAQLTLGWSARGRPSRDYTVFVQVVDAYGQIRAQADAPPESGWAPTSWWAPGDTIADRHPLVLARSLAPGQYQLLVGLYDPATGRRVALLGSEGQPAGDHLALPITVSAPATPN